MLRWFESRDTGNALADSSKLCMWPCRQVRLCKVITLFMRLQNSKTQFWCFCFSATILRRSFQAVGSLMATIATCVPHLVDSRLPKMAALVSFDVYTRSLAAYRYSCPWSDLLNVPEENPSKLYLNSKSFYSSQNMIYWPRLFLAIAVC
jgi:hypothetical protein